MTTADSDRATGPTGDEPVLEPERSGLDRYLEDTIVIDWQTPTVLEKAKALVLGVEDELARVEALFRFVRDEISHSFDIDTDVVTSSASQVLKEGTGLCYAKSHLLAALLRSRGIPAGFGYQRVRDETQARGFALHGFVVVFMQEHETWIVLDPRGDTEEIHTEVDLERPSFAHGLDPEAGETLYPLIFARPSRRVVDLLDHSDNLGRIRHRLPDSLDR